MKEGDGPGLQSQDQDSPHSTPLHCSCGRLRAALKPPWCPQRVPDPPYPVPPTPPPPTRPMEKQPGPELPRKPAWAGDPSATDLCPLALPCFRPARETEAPGRGWGHWEGCTDRPDPWGSCKPPRPARGLSVPETRKVARLPPGRAAKKSSSSGPTAALSPLPHSQTRPHSLFCGRSQGHTVCASPTALPSPPLRSQPLAAGGEAQCGPKGPPGACKRSRPGWASETSPLGPVCPPQPPTTVRGPEWPDLSRPAAVSGSPGAAQQRVASRRRGQGPHWFNISFSFQSIVPIGDNIDSEVGAHRPQGLSDTPPRGAGRAGSGERRAKGTANSGPRASGLGLRPGSQGSPPRAPGLSPQNCGSGAGLGPARRPEEGH